MCVHTDTNEHMHARTHTHFSAFQHKAYNLEVGKLSMYVAVSAVNVLFAIMHTVFRKEIKQTNK